MPGTRSRQRPTPCWLACVMLAGACSPAFQDNPGDTTHPLDSRGDDSEGDDDSDDSADSTPAVYDTAAPVRPVCHAYGPSAQLGTVVDPALDELSGIAVSQRNPGVLWTLEDHGGVNEIYALDHAGNSLGKVILDGVLNNDWEDLSVHPCGDTTCLYVGEIGDNEGERTYHSVMRLPEPEMVLDGVTEVTLVPEIYPYVFADAAFINAEALSVLPDGMPFILSKEYDTGMSVAYTFPALDATQTVTLVERARFSTSADDGTGAPATAADLWPDGSRMIMRTYGHLLEYTLPLEDGVATEASLDTLETASRVELHTGSERQGEAVGYDTVNRGYWTVSEGANPALWFTGCGDPSL